MAVMVPDTAHLSKPTCHGYLLRRSVSEKWVRYWCVVQDGCLYCYLTPDQHVSVDVTELQGYVVTSLEDTFPDQSFVIYLEHDDYIPVYLSAPCRREMEEWKASLTSAVKVSLQQNGVEGQDEINREVPAPTKEDRGLLIKQKLLAEVLKQTQELENKRCNRQAVAKATLSTQDSDTNPLPVPPIPTGQLICNRTRLRQRRMSAQIKLDTLQKQMVQTNNGLARKSRFSFMRKKSSNNLTTSANSNNSASGDDNNQVHSADIVQQLKILSEHLTDLDRDIDLSNGMVLTSAQDTKVGGSERKTPESGGSGGSLWRWPSQQQDATVLSRSNSSRCRRSSSSQDKAGSSDGVTRSNSLKSSMQKFAHKTFAKAGWYRTKKTSQTETTTASGKDKQEVTGRLRTTSVSAVPDSRPNHGQCSDVVDLSQRLRRVCSAREMSQREEEEEVEDIVLPPPSPFKGGDSPSPLSCSQTTVPIDDSRHDNSSKSLQHCCDDLKSSRRRTDPDAIAIIEAFEEMSRQILGEAPT